MSKMAGLKMAVAAAVVGGGVYAVLEVLLPYHHPEVKLEGLVPADAVFGKTAAAPAETTATAATPAPATAAVTETAAIAPSVETKTAPITAEAKPAPVAPPAPAPVAAKPASAPSAAEPPAVAKPAATKPTAKPAAPAQKSANAAPAISPVAWWQGSGSATGLSVSYAGSAAFKRALVVMTNGSFDTPAAPNRSIKVLSADGKPVTGSWEINSSNPGMLVFPVSSNGVYQLVIGADLSDRQNRQLGRVAQGAVEVR